MAYIKKLVMQGFKSFARKTEIVFDKGVSVILGPNGSGKSNVSDALCFVLGRLSIKSMRAAKAKNLLFMGSKYVKPAHEAMVELYFDNTDRAFSIDKDEIVLMRNVRLNGQSIYKINGEVKTRTDIIEMLAQAGIDPHGFNLILQGQIQSIVRMHGEERRKIIEEVAGISVYETRKEKSLHELEKTDEKLKEIGAILRERTAYLKNLDHERTQALKYKELEVTLKRAKATLLYKRHEEKEKEVNVIVKSIEEKTNQKEKLRTKVEHIQREIDLWGEQIQKINKNIQQATGLEQETLHTTIANLKAELEGLRVRKEHYENRKGEIERRIAEIHKSIPDLEGELQELKKESPMMAKKAQELRKKKEEFSRIGEERNKLLSGRTELHSLREILRDKERQLSKASAEAEQLVQQLESISTDLTFKDESACVAFLKDKHLMVASRELDLESLQEEVIGYERSISVAEAEIKRLEQIKHKVKELDICPLCQNKITQEHVHHVRTDADARITEAIAQRDNGKDLLEQLHHRRETIMREHKECKESISRAEAELLRHRSMKERHVHITRATEREADLKKEITALETRRASLESKIIDLGKIQEQYDAKLLEIEEISSRTEEDVDTTILYKERELENVQNIIKRSKKDLEDISIEIKALHETLTSKGKTLNEKEHQERELNARFKKMFEERDKMQKEIQESNFTLTEQQHTVRQVEDQINYLKIGKAKLDAEKEALEMESSEYSGIEQLSGSAAVVEERLKKAQEALLHIGSINMRALEVYEEVKKEYDAVFEKVQTLEKEKGDILAIITEIDQKKRRSFVKTFKAMNELFSQNFSRLSSKGVAFLELENEEDIFSGGVNIIVKLAKGKYFDVTSLSGGEQTLVALSLLFAIQEYKPYHFYIFDEIDAALDKRNSERLAALLQQYMKSGQYIVITHNDAIIMNSNVLYGVSMHDGVSKVLSLKIDDTQGRPPVEENTQAA